MSLRIWNAFLIVSKWYKEGNTILSQHFDEYKHKCNSGYFAPNNSGGGILDYSMLAKNVINKEDRNSYLY